MSRKHPNNGPTLSKTPFKKPKLMTDEQLAAYQSRKASEKAQNIRDAAKEREFRRLLRVDNSAALAALGFRFPPVPPTEPIKRRF
jgi:hypothetical protein